MKTKICIIITAIIFFTASELTAVEDKIFTTDGVIIEGEEYRNVDIYDTPPGQTTVSMSGGSVNRLIAYDSSILNFTGGTISLLRACDFSTINISGGFIHSPMAWDYSTINISGAFNSVEVGAAPDGVVNVMGGTMEAIAGWGGIINLYGGTINDNIHDGGESGCVNIYGYELEKTSSGGKYDYGYVSGFWLDGTSFTIDLQGSGTYSHINLFAVINVEIEIHPETLNLTSTGRWITCHIWFPEDYEVGDIDPNSVLLEDEIQAESLYVDEQHQVAIAKFNRSEIQNFLELASEVKLTVSGHFLDGTYFLGTDTIKVINKGRKNR